MALKVVGSNPINYPIFRKFIKKIFKKKIFKKKIKNLINTQLLTITRFYTRIFLKKNIYITTHNCAKNNKKNFFVNINQKKFNIKSTFSKKNTINIFSVGSIIKYFSLKQGKSSRRCLKGGKIFLNFLKNILEKKYFGKKTDQNAIIQVCGYNYNVIYLKRYLYKILQQNSLLFVLLNISICYAKKKMPKKKSIKKRITKNILINFIKNNKQVVFF